MTCNAQKLETFKLISIVQRNSVVWVDLRYLSETDVEALCFSNLKGLHVKVTSEGGEKVIEAALEEICES